MLMTDQQNARDEAAIRKLRIDLSIGVLMIAGFFAALVFVRPDLSLIYVGWCVLAVLLLRVVLPGSLRFDATAVENAAVTWLRLPAVIVAATALFLLVSALAPAVLDAVGAIVAIGIAVFLVLALVRGGL